MNVSALFDVAFSTCLHWQYKLLRLGCLGVRVDGDK